MSYSSKLLRQSASLLGLGALLSLSTATFAHETAPTYNRISFNVDVQEEVANDEMRATLSKTIQAKTAKEVAKTLNSTINSALAVAKKYPEVTVETGRHNTYPKYGNNSTITGFTGSASIEIKSQNFEQSSQLIADLQTMMALDDLSFHVSNQTKNDTKKQLTINAAKRFQEEALTISQAFGAKDYKIVNVQLGQENSYYARPMMMEAAMAKTADLGIENPNFESGKTTLGYSANGTIELMP